MTRPILIRNAVIVADAHSAPMRGGDILVRDGRIAAIGKDLAVSEDAQVIDASRRIAMPGFVNAHMHSNEAFEQGAYDNLPLEPWLAMSYPPFGFPELSERAHYLRGMLCALESIRSGVTTLQDDLIHPSATPEGLDGTISAYRDIGLRARVTVSMWNAPMEYGIPFYEEIVPAELRARIAASPMPSDATLLALFERHYAKWHGQSDGRLGLALGPCAPQRCSPDLLKALNRIATERDLAMHMHVLETKTQAITGQVLFGKTLVRHLDDLGLLTERLTMNHAIWLTADDIARMGAVGCSVTHNPLSNLKLGSGVCPVRALRLAGVNVAVATDGMATSDTADQVEALRLAAMLHKIESFDTSTWLGAKESFEMSTESGAKSCRIGDIGRLAPGLRADIALLDADHLGFQPLHDPIRQLCFSVNSEAVRDVLIDGDFVMRDRRMTQIDETAIRAEIAAEAERFRVEALPKMAEGAAILRPYIDAIHARATAQALKPEYAVLRVPRIGGFG